ncbi:fungal specific transcription factor domain-containing protein [Colletotrichum tabaci]|uniref:Fungal specific transcription factor domain-containing protein n=1 Tax=Colletotrichum tabaci TaxID=1209068 RepID=A0AAV9T4F0_9PEZI
MTGVSDTYSPPCSEKKIDLIDHRLDSLAKLMGDLKTHISTTVAANSANSVNHASTQATVAPAVASPSTHSGQPDSAAGPVVEGNSSLSAHSVFVNDFLQGFIGSLQKPDPEIRETLDALSHIVSPAKQQASTYEMVLAHARPRTHLQQEKFDLPPIQKAVALIHIAKAQRLAGTGWIYEFITMQAFGDLCLDTYFSEDRSPFHFISVNAGLYSLCQDYAQTASVSQQDKEEHLAYARLCRENLETGLAYLPLHIPASSDAIAALLFGAFYAMEFSKSSLCWALSSKASELCQTLGYHQVAAANSERPADSKYTSFLFWTTYYIDKSLSLRLGRASTIPDWDTTISPPVMPSSDQEPVLAFFPLWVKAAKCQGNIYKMLYSSGSINQPDHIRQSRVDFLLTSLHELEKETERTRDQWLRISKAASGDDLMDFYATSDDILRLSLLTHVHRAAPRPASCPTTFSPECIQVARATLERHHDCMEIIRRTNGIYFSVYIHWTLLFAPFIPFVVVFCHVMETQDRADLALLQAFVNSIQSASTVSEPAAKMLHLFQVLYNISQRYIDLGMSRLQGDQSFSVPQMDTDLAALGFPHAGVYDANWLQQNQDPNLMNGFGGDSMQAGDDARASGNGVHLAQQPLLSVLSMGNGPQLEDWFNSNQASMEMLMDDSVHSQPKE